MIGPHPHKFALGAWFDGEGTESVGSHVARCGRCRRHVSELARVRSWLRAQPFVAMTDGAREEPRDRQPRRVILVVVLLLVGYLAIPGLGGQDRGRSGQDPLAVLGAETPKPTAAPATARQATPSAVEGSGDSETEIAPPVPSGGSPLGLGITDRPVAATRRLKPWPTPLKLGLIVPTTGPLSREGVEVRDVVERRVAAANASGGVAGVPVELVVAPAEDPKAVADLAERVTAIVGGFGAEVATTTPWLLPADPAVTGPNILPAEASPRAVGAQLAGELRAEGLLGLVGVVVGSGPEAGLATGLATKANVTTTTARNGTSCLAEIATLYRSGAMILAVAGDTDLVVSCVRAAARSPWQTRLGPLVGPSAVYAGIESLPEANGARTVLGLPWPRSSAPGAARFRATTASQSYRALVSYAATELAIDVARQTGGVSLASIAGRSWQSDLVALDGLSHQAGSVVTAFLGTWIVAP